MRVAVEYVTLPRDGESENGDAALVRRWEDGALIVVLDALGHGAPAAQTARSAVRYLESAPHRSRAAPHDRELARGGSAARAAPRRCSS